MKLFNSENLKANINALIISATLIGFIFIFLDPAEFFPTEPDYIYYGWALFCLLSLIIANYLKSKQSSEFDFYKVAEPVGRQARRKKQNIEERIAIYLDEDGLDPSILFNEDKSGVAYLLKIKALKPNHSLSQYLAKLNITAKQEGLPIAGQTLVEITFLNQLGYYRLSNEGENELLEFAFPEKTELLYHQVKQVIKLLVEENDQLSVTKVNVANFQALMKFYHYVRRLSAPENRCIEYISLAQGALKICNSSYVELYDCTLQSTLTSWVNQDGLIRTDNVDVELTENYLLALEEIELPYPECRLTNIEIVNDVDITESLQLYLTFAELDKGVLTKNVSGLILIMNNNNISVSKEKKSALKLISVADYFQQKSYPDF
ncbi:hypothetical protein ACLKMH_09295 [Psychromonas sp. KJ10-10]|uniref:hypothetical protein n=1 Tax=Psychromonas sp. KJ10-10 TaxID=3391823 RepID=UPI0039B54C80